MLSQRNQNIIAFSIALVSTSLSVYYFNKPRTYSPNLEKMKRARVDGTRVPKALGMSQPPLMNPTPAPVNTPKAAITPQPKPPENILLKLCGPGWREVSQTENTDLATELIGLRPFFTKECLEQMNQDEKFGPLRHSRTRSKYYGAAHSHFCQGRWVK